jgi:hypothetical protein
MSWVARFVCVGLAYVVVLSVLANPGIGAVMVGSLFFLIFCLLLIAVVKLFTENSYYSTAVANVLFVTGALILQFSSARSTKFTSYGGGRPKRVDGYPTPEGFAGSVILLLVFVACNFVGVAAYHALKNLYARWRGTSANNT